MNKVSERVAQLFFLLDPNAHVSDEAQQKLIRDAIQLEAIATVARKVRDAQRLYFKTRSRTDLIASKQAEAELDKLLKETT